MSINLWSAYHRTQVFTMDKNPQLFVTGDSLEYHHNKPFSTADFDHSRGHCTSRNPGAWWFDWCANSNLNGIYGPGLGYKYIMWDQWLGLKALAGTKMMIRPTNFISGTNYVLNNNNNTNNNNILYCPIHRVEYILYFGVCIKTQYLCHVVTHVYIKIKHVNM